MARYTLTLSPDYVKSWTVSDAIREFLQNAIDQEGQDMENKKSIIIEGNTLRIANAKSILTKKSLLLGGGTKKEGDNNIGQFGEGYKVGLLVLLREGFNVQINNYGVSELWIPKIVNSRVYDSEVLAIDTQEFDFGSNILNSLDIEITKDNFDFNECLRNIWLEFDGDLHEDSFIEANGNQILLDDKYKGSVYVKGLYIGKMQDITYGYNFKPNLIKIGRDRNLVNSFDVRWTIARSLWNKVDYSKENNLKALKDLIHAKAGDVEYIEITYFPNTVKDYLAEDYKDKFVITCESDKKAITDTYGDVDFVVVPTAIKLATYSYQERYNQVIVKAKSAEELLSEFIEKYSEDLSQDMLDELDVILNRM